MVPGITSDCEVMLESSGLCCLSQVSALWMWFILSASVFAVAASFIPGHTYAVSAATLTNCLSAADPLRVGDAGGLALFETDTLVTGAATAFSSCFFQPLINGLQTAPYVFCKGTGLFLRRFSLCPPNRILCKGRHRAPVSLSFGLAALVDNGVLIDKLLLAVRVQSDHGERAKALHHAPNWNLLMRKTVITARSQHLVEKGVLNHLGLLHLRQLPFGAG